MESAQRDANNSVYGSSTLKNLDRALSLCLHLDVPRATSCNHSTYRWFGGAALGVAFTTYGMGSGVYMEEYANLDTNPLV